MLIFGWRTRLRKKAGGVFWCPACQQRSPFTITEARRWFTLFFIPVIPLGTAGSHLTCGTCGAVYTPQVLDPSVQARLAHDHGAAPLDLPPGAPLPPPANG